MVGASNPSGATVVVGEGSPGAEGAPAGVLARQGESGAAVAGTCDHCGQPLQSGQQFCGYCGNRVR